VSCCWLLIVKCYANGCHISIGAGQDIPANDGRLAWPNIMIWKGSLGTVRASMAAKARLRRPWTRCSGCPGQMGEGGGEGDVASRDHWQASKL
jgi:hypothetical protein